MKLLSSFARTTKGAGALLGVREKLKRTEITITDEHGGIESYSYTRTQKDLPLSNQSPPTALEERSTRETSPTGRARSTKATSLSAQSRLHAVIESKSASRFDPSRADRAHLLVDMQGEDESAEQEDGSSQYDSDPWDPISRLEVQLLPPRTWVLRTLGLERDDEHLRVGNDALDVDEVLCLVASGADEEILDVVVRSAEAKVGVGSAERQVGRLRELTVCGREAKSAAERR